MEFKSLHLQSALEVFEENLATIAAVWLIAVMVVVAIDEGGENGESENG